MRLSLRISEDLIGNGVGGSELRRAGEAVDEEGVASGSGRGRVREEMEDLETARGGEVGCVGVRTEGFVGVGLEKKRRRRGRNERAVKFARRVSFLVTKEKEKRRYQISHLHISREIPKLIVMRVPQLSSPQDPTDCFRRFRRGVHACEEQDALGVDGSQGLEDSRGRGGEGGGREGVGEGR